MTPDEELDATLREALTAQTPQSAERDARAYRAFEAARSAVDSGRSGTGAETIAIPHVIPLARRWRASSGRRRRWVRCGVAAALVVAFGVLVAVVVSRPDRGTQSRLTPSVSPSAVGGSRKTTVRGTATWSDYRVAGGFAGAPLVAGQPVAVSCRVAGVRVADGDPWWYRLAPSPWDGAYYAPADAFDNLTGDPYDTPFVDTTVPRCPAAAPPGLPTSPDGAVVTASRRSLGPSTGPAVSGPGPASGTAPAPSGPTPVPTRAAPTTLRTSVSTGSHPTASASTSPGGPDAETSGGRANSWSDPQIAGGQPGPGLASRQTVGIACRLLGYVVSDGNPWWYRLADSPWDGRFYVSADAFYNDGQHSGSLRGTPFYDPAVPVC